VDRYYGFLIDLDLESVEAAQYSVGTEYDFQRKLLIPRSLDSARGDAGGLGALTGLPDDLRRFYDIDTDLVRQTMCDSTTKMNLNYQPPTTSRR
jgi:hypothetical protein